MIWVCILCRKKQELLIKTGTWMHSTAEMSSDPILRRMEQDMAATPTHSSSLVTSSGLQGGILSPARPSTPLTNQLPTSPAASISSLFSKAMSIAGTPTYSYANPPTTSQRPRPPPLGMYPSSMSSRPRGSITRQRSLESSDSGPSPCGYPSNFRAPSRLGMIGGDEGGGGQHPQLIRHRSEGGDDDCLSILSGGEATPTASIPFSPSATAGYNRYRPRFRGAAATTSSIGPCTAEQEMYHHTPGGGGGPKPRPPFLTRGHSLGESPVFPSLPPSFSFHNRPITSNVATPMSVQSLTESITGSITALTGSITGSLSLSGGHAPPPPPAPTKGGTPLRLNMEVMSAPEDTYHDITPSSLYPRVLVSDSEARDMCPPLMYPHSDDNRGMVGGSMGQPDMTRLMDPRVMRTSNSRRKLDSTFRNDSLSSDQSECLGQQQRPPPPKPHKHKRHAHSSRGGSGIRPFGVSSSDEEIRSTPECTSCGEEEMESESVSEKGRHLELRI